MDEVKITRATIAEKEIMKNVMQFYFYDFSQFVEAHLEENGRFEDDEHLDLYWMDPTRFPYLLYYKGKIAGFCLVRKIEEAKKTYFSIAEFFVMKKYRRHGLGKLVAHEMFTKHHGEWEVFQMETNVPAQQFWRSAIGEFTSGNFTEETVDKKVIQKFSS